MKSKYKYLASAAFSGLFGLLIAFSASAQRGGGGSRGGGGGGSHGGGFSGGSRGGSFNGGGGGSFNRGGNFGGGGSFNRGGNFGGGRTSAAYSAPRNYSSPAYRGNAAGGGNRVAYAAPRGVYGNRGSVAYSRGGFGYGAPRSGFRLGVGIGGSYYHGSYRSYNPFAGHYAYYNQFYAPRLGFHLNILPYGYYPFYWGDYEYFYSGGYYYQYNNNNYTVVEPPVGAIINQLPAGARSLMIDGEQYYELNGVYYQAITKDDGNVGYQIAGKDGQLTTGAGAPQQDDVYGQAQPQPQYQPQPQVYQTPPADSQIKIGDLFDKLPANCSTVKIDGQKYFVSPDGVYYQEDHDGNHKVYRVAGTGNDQP